MGNPARELAVLLDRWRVVPASTTVYDHRGLADGDTVRFWRDQVVAARLLAEVDSAIAALEVRREVGHFRRSVENWYRGVFGPDVQWNALGGYAVELTPQAAVDQLNGLADLLDVLESEPVLTGADRTTIIEAVDEIAAILKGDDTGLTESEQHYIFELILSIRAVVEEGSLFGAADLQRRINELIGAITKLAATLGTEGDVPTAKRLWASVSKVFRYGFFGGRIAARGIEVGAALHQLTQ